MDEEKMNHSPEEPPRPNSTQPLPPHASYAWPPDGGNAPKKSGRKADFHLSFWPTLVAVFLVYYLAEGGGILELALGLSGVATLIPVIIIVAAVVLRFVLEKKNHYLAKGFMWAAIFCVAIPIICFFLLLGSCLLMVAVGI